MFGAKWLNYAPSIAFENIENDRSRTGSNSFLANLGNIRKKLTNRVVAVRVRASGRGCTTNTEKVCRLPVNRSAVIAHERYRSGSGQIISNPPASQPVAKRLRPGRRNP